LAATILGGGQERGHRAGTENVSGIAGFGAAASAATALSSELRDRFESGLKAIAPNAVIFGASAPRLTNTSNFALPTVAAETAVMALDLDGVMVSSGSACSSGKVRPSQVLRAMGVSETLAGCALRVSFGWNSVEADVDAALASISHLASRVKARAAA
jgi:cysteine desulfurase